MSIRVGESVMRQKVKVNRLGYSPKEDTLSECQGLTPSTCVIMFRSDDEPSDSPIIEMDTLNEHLYKISRDMLNLRRTVRSLQAELKSLKTNISSNNE